jgi:hypothetical protein
MSLIRAVVSVASIFLGLSAAGAQQLGTATNNAAASASSALTNPPVFQGLMVDAKGKTVGRLVPNITSFSMSEYFVVRQISGVWLALPVADLATGFALQTKRLEYYYQSSDCTGQAYLPADQTTNSDILAFGIIATVPPATQPSIYFAEMPWSKKTFKSALLVPGSCSVGGGEFSAYVGLPQSLPVSSLGLTLPFSIK